MNSVETYGSATRAARPYCCLHLALASRRL